jgi:hypothetical protein
LARILFPGIDPFGLDANEVNYDYCPVNTGYGFHLPLGHAGVVSVNPATGETRYYEYGRYEDKECGNVERRKVPLSSLAAWIVLFCAAAAIVWRVIQPWIRSRTDLVFTKEVEEAKAASAHTDRLRMRCRQR